MDVLLTFTGFHDPYFKGLVDQEEQPGPILSLLAARPFDQIFLFDTPMTKRVTQETKDAISKLHRESTVHVLEINLADPTNYQEIFKGLRTYLRRVIEGYPSANFFIAVASGTPQMGISLPNGFDTTKAANSLTTWTRLGRKERDDIQREFDPASNRHKPIHRFKVP